MQDHKRAAIYMRVSTTEQDNAMQERELRAYVARRGWALAMVSADKGVSGGKEQRPALDRLMLACRRRKVDVVVVWRFDRFARSLRHLLNALAEFKGLGVNFVSATEAIDTTTPAGELVFQVFGAIAQFERGLIGERVRAGLSNARAKGQRLGRPPRRELTPAEHDVLRHAHSQGKSLRALAVEHGISLWAAHRACLNQGVRNL